MLNYIAGNLDLWTMLLKIAVVVIFGSSILVVINAILSAKTLGGPLGKGLKKIAAGTITYVILFLTILIIQNQGEQILIQDSSRLYFMAVNIFGSLLLISGYIQIYRTSKKLNLF